jgi:hypothetical protein
MSNQSTKAKRFKALVKALRIAMTIIGWTCAATACLGALAAATIAFIPSQDLGAYGQARPSADAPRAAVNLKILDFELDVEPGMPRQPIILASLLACLPYLAWTGLVAFLLGTMLKRAEAGIPFHADNAKTLGWLALAAICKPAAGMIGGNASKAVLNAGLGLDLGYVFNYDISALLGGLLILVLAGVFRYGAELQHDLDGTV